MKTFDSLLRDYLADIEKVPDIKIVSKKIEFNSKNEKYLNPLKDSFLKDYGFQIPEPKAQLLIFGTIDIIWETIPEESYLKGQINIINPSESFLYPYHIANFDGILPEYDQKLYYFDTNSANSYNPSTVMIYDKNKKKFSGLALIYDNKILPLELNMDEYINTVIQWKGGFSWQLLYISKENFETIPFYWKKYIYQLCILLPKIFPMSDWSIIKERESYFNTTLK